MKELLFLNILYACLMIKHESKHLSIEGNIVLTMQFCLLRLNFLFCLLTGVFK